MAALINRYPLWKYILIFVVLVAAFLYAAPNLYGDYPAVQVRGANATIVDQQTLETVKEALQANQLAYHDMLFQDQTLVVRFTSTDLQLKAKAIIQTALGETYMVAINLSPAMPNWLKAIGALPMKLGLDLRGGVHFLLQVDVDSVVKQRTESDLRGISQALRDERIRYSNINRQASNQVEIEFRTQDTLNDGYDFVMRRYSEFTWTKENTNGRLILRGVLLPAAFFQAKEETLEQAMNTLRNRVNELGVSEAIVQQQGENRISVDLPGIQDTADAKNILGKTATLEFHMVDVEHDARDGMVPEGSRIYMYQGRPLLLKDQIILRGSSIVAASSGFDENGRANVQVRLGGSDSLFTKTTAESIGKPMAVVYIEVKSVPKLEDGNQVITYQTQRQVISVATIQATLGTSFQITGLTSQNEARKDKNC